MPNATAAGYKFAYLAEVTPGTTPSSALKLMRNVGGGGKLTAQSAESDEIHLAEVPDVIRTGVDANGVVNGEPSYSALDDIMEAILGGTWTTNVLQAGVVARTFTCEDQYTDAGVYMPWKYSIWDSLSIGFQQGAKPNFKATYVCAAPPTAGSTSTAGTGAATAAPTNDIMDPIGSIQLAQEGGSGSLLAGAPGVTAFSIDITRPVIKMPQLGTLSLAGAVSERLAVKGSISLYFATKALLDKYLANTQTSLALTVGGASAKKYAFLMSKLRFVDGGVQEVAKSQAVIQTYNYQATYDATNSSLKVTRTP